ncbi:GDSL-type esterase/lipase family protein [Pseudoroseomonas cervicalis]|uniref:GDSL-type esterase/lipase family protein n=1 Tax=Teichococcus cervicalis TaxID=204525 RepID=UPI0022F1BE0D|nr:GDSL-type esterase/lipase family protein [Pseudoroseomonas cervicalis]WBV43149.1 GDSL-type esterase/lipase family protein [Pseudoroseomonas cervicalis]
MNRRELAQGLVLAGTILGTGGLAAPARAQQGGGGAEGWVTAWTGSAQGPYPVGNPSAQPNQSFAFPSPAEGARDQSFRLVLRPDLWGRRARLRFSNAFGTRPLQIASVHAGLHWGGAALLPGSNRPVTFGGAASASIPPGGQLWSDAVDLPFAAEPDAALLTGRKLAVSFHVAGPSGPMTWHAKALQTSYVSPPGSGDRAAEESEAAFSYSTASWFFLDAVDMTAPAGTPVVLCFGDSITDGTASTMNGDDRWPDVLARRLHASLGNRVAVVNAGIGGNQVVGPAEYSAEKPFPGGPSALARLERDIISLSGIRTVVWLEGTNDFSRNGNASFEAVRDGMRQGVERLRAAIPGLRVVGATVTPALGSSSAAHGHAEQDEKRRQLNAFLREGGLFDAVVDFDAVTRDPATGGLKPEMVPDSTTGAAGDKLHPNRAGYLAMGFAVPPAAVLPPG